MTPRQPFGLVAAILACILLCMFHVLSAACRECVSMRGRMRAKVTSDPACVYTPRSPVCPFLVHGGFKELQDRVSAHINRLVDWIQSE